LIRYTVVSELTLLFVSVNKQKKKREQKMISQTSNYIIDVNLSLCTYSTIPIVVMGEDVKVQWSGGLIFVSFVLAFMGAYSTVCLAEQHRIAGSLKAKVFTQPMYLVMMAISMGGGCIWSMHFIGMSAVSFTDQEGNELAVRFDIVKSFLSMMSCIVCVFVGLYISSRDKMFCREKEEIFELILAEGKADSLDMVRQKHYLIKVALFRGTGRLILGGIIAGGGVCIMHYIGMLAMTADMKVHWNGGVVFASVLIAVVAATAAFWILFRLLALYPTYESLRFLSSLVAGIAVCGMHYTGMLAATYTVQPDPDRSLLGPTMTSDDANAVALTIGVVITWGASMAAQAELRTWHSYVHGRLKAARKVLDQLHQRYDSDMLLQDFEAKNNKVTSVYEHDRTLDVSGPSKTYTNTAVVPEGYDDEDDDVKVLPTDDDVVPV
jgi:NO-binding membrane sensor protein with MHYT domain